MLAVSILVFIVNLVRSYRRGEYAGRNPWGAPTLEWAISSPPPHYNFAVIPTVHSLYPLWDEEANAVEPPYVEERHVHMPAPSYWPLLMAMGIAMAAGGLIVWKANPAVGIAMIALSLTLGLYSAIRWSFEPAMTEEGEGAHAVH